MTPYDGHVVVVRDLHGFDVETSFDFSDVIIELMAADVESLKLGNAPHCVVRNEGKVVL